MFLPPPPRPPYLPSFEWVVLWKKERGETKGGGVWLEKTMAALLEEMKNKADVMSEEIQQGFSPMDA